MTELAHINPENTPARISSEALPTVTAPPTPAEWTALKEQAQVIVASGMAPKSVRTAEQVLTIALKARELRLPPMQGLAHIHIIEGKPTLSAELMVALVQRAGHKLRVVETSAQKCTVEGVRADDPNHPQKLTFTIEEARQAGVAGKSVWKNYPAAMLRARAISALCRFAFADVLMGASYVPEELGAEVDEEGRPLAGQVVSVEPEVESHPESEVQAEDVVEAEVVEAKPAPARPRSEEHEGVLKEIGEVFHRIPEGKRPNKREVWNYAKESIENARKALSRLEALAKSGRTPAGEITDDQLGRLRESLDRLYGTESDVLDGHEWYQENHLNKPLEELTAAQAEEVLTWLDGELGKAKPATPDGVKETVESWDEGSDEGGDPNPSEVAGVERGGAARKRERQNQGAGNLPATKKQLNYLESLVDELNDDPSRARTDFEDMVGKALHELTREEASEWISRLSGREA